MSRCSFTSRVSKLPAATTSASLAGRSRPRTTTTSAGHRDNEIICALSEARGISPTVGLAFVNISTSEAVLCQFADTQTFARTCHKIKVFGPSEILFATSAADAKLVSILRENLQVERNDIMMTSINRRYWSEDAGHDYLQQYANPDDLESLKLSLAGNYFAVCCFAAVLKYTDLGLGISFIVHGLRITFEPSEGAMMVDLSTIAALELVQNLCDARSKECLFGLLNETQTSMGARMLKSNILQPSTDTDKILKRYEALSELSTKEAMYFAVREALRGFVDTDRTLAALVTIRNRIDFDHMEQSVNHALMLKTFVDMIKPVWQALSTAESTELQKIHQLCDPNNYLETQELLEYALNENVRYSTKPTELRNQRVWALKAGHNGFLDVARQTYNEIGDDIKELVDELKSAHDLSMDLKYDPARQFFVRIKAADVEERQLPEIFVNVHRNKNSIECQTLDLLKLNQKLKDAHNEVIVMSDGSIQELIEQVRSKVHPLFKISEGLALLDMLSAFAHHVTTQNYVQPELTSTLAMKSARHPVREKIQRERFVPNDVYATRQTRFQIITGCNMSGKSTYIQLIAISSIMAQIGCFVPADYASFPIIHQLFARVSTDDNIEANVSTFASEMREVAFILHNIEPRSLVIVDELGRGTSTTDGLAIAIAISEALIDSKALVWFVTHFKDLPRVLAERAGVVNLHLSVDISADLSRMKMKYKIADGCEEQKFYGLALARLVCLPEEIISSATEISKELHARGEARKQNAKALSVAKKRKLVLKLKEQLLQAKESERDEEHLRQWLKKLQEEFVLRMAVIDAEAIAEGTAEAFDQSVDSNTVEGSDRTRLSPSADSSKDDSVADHSQECSNLSSQSEVLYDGRLHHPSRDTSLAPHTQAAVNFYAPEDIIRSSSAAERDYIIISSDNPQVEEHKTTPAGSALSVACSDTNVGEAGTDGGEKVKSNRLNTIRTQNSSPAPSSIVSSPTGMRDRVYSHHFTFQAQHQVGVLPSSPPHRPVQSRVRPPFLINGLAGAQPVSTRRRGDAQHLSAHQGEFVDDAIEG